MLPAELSPRQAARTSDLGEIAPVQMQKNRLEGLAGKNSLATGAASGLIPVCATGLNRFGPAVLVETPTSYAKFATAVLPELCFGKAVEFCSGEAPVIGRGLHQRQKILIASALFIVFWKSPWRTALIFGEVCHAGLRQPEDPCQACGG